MGSSISQNETLNKNGDEISSNREVIINIQPNAFTSRQGTCIPCCCDLDGDGDNDCFCCCI